MDHRMPIALQPPATHLSAEQQAKRDRKLARKEAKRLAAQQGQTEAVGQEQKKRQRTDSDADVQGLLVPSTTPRDSPAIDGKQQDAVHHEKKRKIIEAGSALDTLAEAALVHGAASARVEALARVNGAPETAKELRRRHREERRQAKLNGTEPEKRTAEEEAARKARKAEKKERKRLAQQSIEPDHTSKLAEQPDTSKLAGQPQASTSKLAEDDHEAIAPSNSKGKGKAKEVEQDDGDALAAVPAKKKRKSIVRKDNPDVEAEWQKVGESNPGLELASKWMSLAQVRTFAAEHNFKYRQGVFSNAEEARIQEALKRYRTEFGFSQADLTKLILAKRTDRKAEGKNESADLWTTLARAVGGRPVLAIYNHVKRAFDPQAKSGEWTAAEDAELKAAFLELGSQWTKVSHRVGRNPTDCKDRYTKHLEPKVQGGKKKMGRWEKEEEDKLRHLFAKHGNSWTTIEKYMGGRTATQCRIKREALARKDALRALVAPTAKANHAESDEEAMPDADLPHFTSKNRSTLVHCINDQNPPDASEIDWKNIDDTTLKAFGPVSLKDSWRRASRKAEKALRSVSGGEAVSFQDIMAHLLEKYPVRGEAPPKRKKVRAPKKKKEKVVEQSKFKSAAFVDSDEGQSTDNESD